MKTLLMLCITVVLLASVLVIPVSAHEEYHGEDNNVTPAFCLVPNIDVIEILPDDPGHLEFHEAEVTDSFQEKAAIVVEFPHIYVLNYDNQPNWSYDDGAEYSVQDGCHSTQFLYRWKCTKYVRHAITNEWICVDGFFYLYGIHWGHCDE